MQENRMLSFEDKATMNREKDCIKDENTKPSPKALVSLSSNEYSIKDIIK